MENLKHVGRMAKTKRRIVVAYRVVPGEPENCIIVTTENLSADEHDALIKLVESEAGQSSEEFANAMARTPLPDGRTMLPWFHNSGKMVKVRTDEVEMCPNRNTTIMLNELNEHIANQKGVTVDDLAIGGAQARTAVKDAPEIADPASAYVNQDADTVPVSQNAPMSDQELAAMYRSDAARLYKEAKALRDQAEELAPSKKKATKK